jgi:hypothetical protein
VVPQTLDVSMLKPPLTLRAFSARMPGVSPALRDALDHQPRRPAWLGWRFRDSLYPLMTVWRIKLNSGVAADQEGGEVNWDKAKEYCRKAGLVGVGWGAPGIENGAAWKMSWPP